MNQTTDFDQKTAYQATIAPLLEGVSNACKEIGVPFFFTAAVCDENGKTEYITESRSALTLNLMLSDDKIVDHLKICAGFRAVIPETLPDVEL